MTTIQTTAPLYVQFAHAIRSAIRAEGLPEPTAAATPTGFPENEGYFFVEWGTHGVAPALIVPKSKTRMGNIHSHVDLNGIAGYVPLPKRNGRVVCHFEPDVTKVSRALHLFVGASKRPVAPPVRRLAVPSVMDAVNNHVAASQATVRVGSLADVELPAGDLEVASWATQQSYSDEDAEEALQALIHQAD